MTPTFINLFVGKQGNAIKICLNGCRINVVSHGSSMYDGHCPGQDLLEKVPDGNESCILVKGPGATKAATQPK